MLVDILGGYQGLDGSWLIDLFYGIGAPTCEDWQAATVLLGKVPVNNCLGYGLVQP